MNRGARRLRLFERDADYQSFLGCLILGLHEIPLRLLAYCVMPNHFHLVVWPAETGQISRFMKLVTGTHSKRWHRLHGTEGTGCVYQGRYRGVVVRQDAQFLTLCKYVERNALRAKLVGKAEDWPWSSLHQRCKSLNHVQLEPWPIPQPSNWLAIVNEPDQDADLKAMRSTVGHRRPGRPPKKYVG
jgi:putative transposase